MQKNTFTFGLSKQTKLSSMKLFLKPEDHSNIRTRLILSENPIKSKSNFLSDLWKFAVDNDIVQDTYVVQRDDEEPDNDIRLSMNEINDMYETGECPEDLDFF